MITLLLALAVLQQPPAAQGIPADSYADSVTRALVEHARGARDRNGGLVTGYRALARQRLGVGLRALSRDRMLYREESVARIAWHRDSPSSIEFLGARQAVPVAVRGDMVPDDLKATAQSLIFDPAADYLRTLGGSDEQMILYPLSDGAEREYRFALGEAVSIALPQGRTIRIVGLEVIPRRASPNLMAGTLWFDTESYDLVRAVYRPARPYETRRDATSDKDIPSWVNARFEVKFVTIEYGLYNGRWWMPRYMAIDGVGSMGAWLGVPFRMERTYEQYEVEGGTPPDPASTFRPAGRVVRNRPGNERGSAADSLRARTAASNDSNLTVIVPPDTLSLLTSPLLGPPILDMGDLISESELRRVGGVLDKLPPRPWDAHLELPRGFGALLRGARYNRVEALSVEPRVQADFGRLQFDARVRIPTADLEHTGGELALIRETPERRVALTGYRRLAAANPDARPFSTTSSLLAFIAQRDDGEYYRATGAELTAANPVTQRWSARLYYQREARVDAMTDVALPHFFADNQRFRPNIVADYATQYGGSVTLRSSRPLSRTVQTGLSTTLDGADGTYRFARGAMTLRGFLTPESTMAAALTLSAGTSTGELPVQSQFFLGGPGSLRGYDGGAARGEAFWLVRAEAGTSFPGARVVGFTDIGWAGPRSAFGQGSALSSVGAGVSLLDGLVRIDLARALQGAKGWRLEFYLDGAM